ncbi:MAG: AbrB/MazE/SpoVT family DNA-binding domain-containing protein [Acidobacteria bacterium]|nr:AbrB/MazE/SpoVT family DNA-binding domain-containing protein [Acidobacteriota bacterium]
MSIVTVKDKYQVVIPQSVRQQLGINRGDMLEAKVERGKLVYTPKVLIDRLREIAPTPPALKAIQEDAKRKGTDKLTMRQIDAEVAAVRRRSRKKK